MIGPHKKWEPGLVDKLRKFLLSITFQAAVQTATGEQAALRCSEAQPAGLAPWCTVSAAGNPSSASRCTSSSQLHARTLVVNGQHGPVENPPLPPSSGHNTSHIMHASTALGSSSHTSLQRDVRCSQPRVMTNANRLSCAGVFLICCFYFSSEIRFTIEYIAGIFVILGLVLASFNPHLGARTLAAAFITTLALPAIIAGVVVGPLCVQLTCCAQPWPQQEGHDCAHSAAESQIIECSSKDAMRLGISL